VKTIEGISAGIKATKAIVMLRKTLLSWKYH
jgi:hypothetical protein